MSESNSIRILPLSPRDTVPLALEHPGGQVIYHLSAPTILERQRFRRDLTAAGVFYPSESEAYDAMRADVRALIHPDDVGRLLALIDVCDAAQDRLADGTAAEDLLGKDDARTFALLEEELRRAGAVYARILADRSHYIEVATVMAAARFTQQIEGLDILLERHGGLLADSVLDALPSGHLGQVGLEVLRLLRPDGDARKNSPSSPNTPGPRESSRAAASRPKARKAGGSARTATRKTRSSRSRPSGSTS